MEPQPADRPAASPDEQPGAHTTDQPRADRIAALSKLAAANDGTSTPSEPVHSPKRSHAGRSPRFRFRAIALVSLAVLVVGAGIGYAAVTLSRTGSRDAALPAVITLNLQAARLICPAALTWSPDGAHLAAWGSSSSCEQGQPLFVALYDARTGHEQRTINFADFFAARNLTATLSALTWSPDGQALIAQADLAPSQRGDAFRQALLVFPLNGDAPRLSAPITPSPAAPVLWNVPAVSGSAVSAALPSAFAYEWTAQGSVVPAQAFPQNVSSGGATSSALTGRPAPHDGFSFWQSGQIAPIWPLNPTGGAPDRSRPPAAAQFTSSPILWSPDGQWLSFMPHLQSVVAMRTPPTPPAPVDPLLCQALNLPASCRPAVVPLPDAATAEVLRAVQRPVSFSLPDGTALADYRGAALSWSPNGKLLATILPPDQFSGVTTLDRTTVTVFNTSTAGARARLRYSCPLRGGGCSTRALSWSPSGQQLAALDSGADLAVLWNTQQLAG
jgi:WD40 repeat protein